MAAIFIIVLCFAEVSSRFQDTGGPYLYALASFGPLPAFLTGWLLLLTRFITYAALINLLVTYLGVFSPTFTLPFPRILTISLITLLLGWINHIGIRNTTRANNLLTLGKLLPLILFIGVGVYFIDPLHFHISALPEFSNISATTLLWIFAFGGFESVLVNSGEVKNPGKTLPFALLIATLCIATIYIAILFVSIGTLPGLANSERPLADAASLFMGKTGAVIIAVGAIVSITGTLNAIMLVGSRLPYAFSVHGQFPGFFKTVHPRYATPVWSLWAFAIVTLIVSLSQNFIAAATLSAITRVMIYGIICLALLRLRKRQEGAKNFLKLRYGKQLAWLAFPIIAWLLSSSKPEEIRSIAIAIGVGILIYLMIPKNRGQIWKKKEEGIDIKA
jgi:amino acid transporter